MSFTKSKIEKITETQEILNIYKNYRISGEIQKQAEKFISAEEKYLFGKNEYSKAICEKLKINYIVDDFTSEINYYGAKIIKTKDVPINTLIVNCVVEGQCTIAYNHLIKNNIKNILSYSDLCYLYPEKFRFPHFTLDTREDFTTNIDKFQKIFDLLTDEESIITLKSVLLYRLTSNRIFLENFKLRVKEQYFEDFLNFKCDEVFVDCGGFNGDTSEEFIKRCPNYNKIYFFEPSKQNMLMAKERLKAHSNIIYIEKGVSDKEEVLKFTSSIGCNSNISEDGEEEIKVVRIDDIIDEPYTFIKMDLEGWEMKALSGAEETLKKYDPKMAICVYHNSSDFYNVIDFIKNNVKSSRKLYIRHYTQGWVDTVALFV